MKPTRQTAPVSACLVALPMLLIFFPLTVPAIAALSPSWCTRSKPRFTFWRMKLLPEPISSRCGQKLQAHTGRVPANPLERKTGEVCGSPPRRAYPMGRGKPLSPCPFAGGRENPADLRVGERIYCPQSTAGSGI